ncbi:preprotein translocase subunit SecE [Nocardioides sp. zg-536]|uniref:Protein translocase subunit SecE n=1 Tax=Nocardioides faecalis TaxID=2803858 RepID=A0A938YBH6_9ACTN|nr:preprotein translocase subunit SecE [Nocardioides faecalis]MBM9460956.1 preprotein translocase subunit SecE [Nocardioides faecalis]MBS4751931.1 preprotein translocase subunit SecE [Nocardioides faecalis]QVI59221.1 preprotein translocase subunit SecE [Nocardioides faecalis]
MSNVSDAPAVGGRKDAPGGKQPEKRTGPVTFYRQVVAELRKVVYPTREQLVTYFFVVLAFVLVMIAIVSVLDLGFGKLAFEVFTGADDI